jgi:hypothetical protein
MLRLFSLVVALLVVLPLAPASAMEFRLLQAHGGQRLVLASGAIGPGDAQQLVRALNLATRDKNHTKQLLLDSPGGSVAEALAMADVMDQVGVSTVVPAQAICGSACASILFVSGKYRTIERGGRLAIHSCYDRYSGVAMEECNRIISEHAQYEGVPGAAMMAFQEVAGPHSALVFDAADAACFGITRRPGSPAVNPAPCLKAALQGHRRR